MSTNVLIVGAGPTGLILALALLRNGVPVRIIEKQTAFQLGTRGCGIQPRTVELYKLLGLLPDLLEIASPPISVHKLPSPQGSNPGQAVSMIEIMEPTPSRPYNTGVVLGQERQEGLLRARLLKDYGCQVELATELRSFEEHEDSVIAHIAKKSGDTETVKVNWLVGADGGRSTIRKQLDLKFVGESIPAVAMVIGDIEAQEGTLDQKVWRIWGGLDKKGVSLRPCRIPGKNRLNFFVGGSEIDHEKVASSREELVHAITEITGREDIKLGELICMGVWRPNIRMTESFGKGRVFLAGDACHVHSPTGGQGMNSGVQDSLNLAWKIALADKNLSPKSILDSYSKERVPVISAMLNKTTELFQKTFKPVDPDSVEGWQRGYELRMFGVNYRKSSILLDERYTDEEELVDPYRSGEDGTVRAGDRAPDAPELALSAPPAFTMTLFDIFRPTHHTALVFAGSSNIAAAENVLKTLRDYPEGVVKTVLVLPQSTTGGSSTAELSVVDAKGFAYKHYNVAEDKQTIVIVRPDGFIGAFVGGVEGVKKYFEKILL